PGARSGGPARHPRADAPGGRTLRPADRDARAGLPAPPGDRMTMYREEEPPVLEAASPDELFLLRLRYTSGRVMEAGSDRPIVLDTADTIWVVYSGQVDLFAVPIVEGKPAGPRRHLCRIAAGEAVFGMDPGRTASAVVVAVGGAGTRLIRVLR